MNKLEANLSLQRMKRIEDRVSQLNAKASAKSAMAIRSKERREEWIGNTLDNMVTDIKYVGKAN